MENENFTYKKFQYDKLLGKPLYRVDKCGGENQYRIKVAYLSRNTDGMLGFVGDGITWFLANITETGPYAFNPIKEDILVWLPLHNGYCVKHDLEHFEFPFIVGEFYNYEDGKKYLEWKGEVCKMNYPRYI